jgi:hypothetical protein
VKTDRLLVFVLVAAIAALGGTAAWAVVRATDTTSTTNYYGGMMGSGSGGMMSGSGSTMMGANDNRSAWYLNGSGPVRDIAAARAQAQRFADRLGLKTGEVMQFTNTFYVLLVDRQGKPATEVLVDPKAGTVMLEYGPAMMWNTGYGMMGRTGATGSDGMMGGGMMGGRGSGGMMGGRGSGGMMSGGMMGGGSGMDGMMGRYGGSPNWTPGNVTGPVDAAEARSLANRWLAQQGTGLGAAEPDALPGYFTFHTLENGKVAGMLSVNEQTGAVWYHWWHGRFVAMEE